VTAALAGTNHGKEESSDRRRAGGARGSPPPARRRLGGRTHEEGLLNTRSSRDLRRILPRFQGENLARNLALVEALRALAREKKTTVARLAIAWVLSRGEDVVPLVGARTRERLAESLGALTTDLSPEDLARIETAVPAGAAAGSRYDTHGMAILDSERPSRRA